MDEETENETNKEVLLVEDDSKELRTDETSPEDPKPSAPPSEEEQSVSQIKIKEDLDKLEEIVQKQSEAFDKHIITLAATLFGASAIYLKDIVGDHPKSVWMLGTSWIMLGVCIGSILLSFLVSQIAIRQVKDQIRGTRTEPIIEWPNWLNWSAYATFLLGAILFGIIVISNLSERKEEECRIQKSHARAVARNML